MPLQREDGTWVYLFRDNDVLNGKPYSGVACHYDGEKRNWTKTLDPIKAIELCGDLNEQAAKWEKEQRLIAAAERMSALDDLYGKKTNPTKGFWPFYLFR